MEKLNAEFKPKVVKTFLGGDVGANVTGASVDRARRKSVPRYDICNPNLVAVWQRNLDESGAAVLRRRKQGRPSLKSVRCCPEPQSLAIADSEQTFCTENEPLRAEGAYQNKIARLDSEEEISCADKARLITGLMHHHKPTNSLQIAGLARGTFYYQCWAILHTELKRDREAKVRAIYDEHKGR